MWHTALLLLLAASASAFDFDDELAGDDAPAGGQANFGVDANGAGDISVPVTYPTQARSFTNCCSLDVSNTARSNRACGPWPAVNNGLVDGRSRSITSKTDARFRCVVACRIGCPGSGRIMRKSVGVRDDPWHAAVAHRFIRIG